MTCRFDSAFDSVYNELEGLGGEIEFISEALSYLAKRSPTFTANPSYMKQVLKVAKRVHGEALERSRVEESDDDDDAEVLETPGVKKDQEERASEQNVSVEEKNAAERADSEISEEDKLKDAPVGNGGKTDKYVWTQTLAEVTMTFEVPQNLRSRDMNVVIKPQHLMVAIKGQDAVVNGAFPHSIIVDDSTWTLEQEFGKSTKTLTVFIKKLNTMNWWNCAIVGDAQIDTKKIVPENSKLHDLDPETRKTVEKMMFDQRQKAAGMPTSDELEKQKILEKLMKANPDMDFSQAKFM